MKSTVPVRAAALSTGPGGGRAVANMARPGRFSVESLSSIHALLIDDDPASREELVRILRYCGALVTAAESDVEGLRVLRVIRPDVVVLAVPRRHRGELAVLRRLQSLADPIPVIAIVWPGDETCVNGLNVVTLQRPLEAWDLCRTLATAVTVE
jgi:CheY-like chemotaxis protein